MRRLPIFLATFLFSITVLAHESIEGAVALEDSYTKNEILQEVENFFGEGAENLGQVVEKAFNDYGQPNAYIAGEEAAAALGLGVRYGKGSLQNKTGLSEELYWQGPSIGFDAGADVAKVFILIYNLKSADDLYQRYPGVEGSLYFVGGAGVNYLQSGDTIIAPIRFGAGWRQGINIGYMDFTREASVIPL